MTPAEEFRLRCVEAVVEEGERVGILAAELDAAGRLGVVVPWVPAWTAADLVGHLGTVHRWATAIVTAGTADAPPPRPEPPDGDLLGWYGAGLTALVRALRETPPDAPAWHMSPAAPGVAAEWARRQAHELAVHRMDLEAAAGVRHAPLDPALAADGVAELLGVVVPRWAHTEPLRSAQVLVAVSDTATGRRWEVRVTRGAVEVADAHSGGAQAHLSGEGTQLLLHLWGRPADVRVEGDAAAESVLRGR
ncbi:maleylpyruvate isomerase N-terminal domain-containing protein [Geodermatophilus sp. SYSU D00815]